MHFSLPESFAAYVSQRDVKAAVDHILDSKSLEVPADLGWEHLPDFHAAVLAAYQVRSDYATSLHQIWNEVWQPVLDSSDIEIQALSIVEAQEWGNVHVDTENVWRNEELYRYFRKNGSLIILGVGLDSNEARLYLWFGDEQGENSKAEKLSLPASDWYLEEEGSEEWGYTSKGLAPIRNGCVELDRLRAAAKRAVTKIIEVVTS